MSCLSLAHESAGPAEIVHRTVPAQTPEDGAIDVVQGNKQVTRAAIEFYGELP